MSNEILIARHGETDWNRSGRWQGHSDIELNETGINQAEQLVEAVSGLGIKSVYSSDLARARETARIVANGIGIDNVSVDSRLRERSLGTFEGLTGDEIRSMLSMSSGYLSIRDLDTNSTVEPWENFVSRIEKALDDIRVSSNMGKVLVVAHGGVMMALSMNLLERYEKPLRFSNGELIRLTYDSRWHLEFLSHHGK